MVDYDKLYYTDIYNWTILGKECYIIYCRTGNRSATASQLLVDLGYENIYDMGGIIYWPYETVS